MSRPAIDAGVIPHKTRSPVLSTAAIPAEKFFTFSLRYWHQPNNFGLGGQDTGWFISLLNRLNQICKEKLVRFFEDGAFIGEVHFHEVDWQAKNIPLKRNELVWIPEKLRKNSEEYPIFQFFISKANGRIHGFFDADHCFNIILLDPMHNLQPSNYNKYAVRNTVFGMCEYSKIKTDLDRAREQHCNDDKCPRSIGIEKIFDEAENDKTVITARLEPGVASALEELRKRGNKISISEIVSHGILFCEEKP